VHFDAAGDAEAYDSRMWSVDRLHPSERGHRLIARRFHALLGATGLLLGPCPDAEPSSPAPGRPAEICWLATKGTAWVLRRSTDLVPALLAMAVKECLFGGRDPHADRAQDREAAARRSRLAQVSGPPGTRGPGA
jgi:hypothetical protein